METKPPTLWRHPDFMKLWFGETISILGSQITLLALPLVAAITLEATPIQMGALGTAQYIPWLLVGLFAGVWADRLLRRPIMILADIVRAILLSLIPITALLGILRMEYLYVIGFLVGMMNVFFDVSYISYLPTLIPKENLVEGNSKLQMTASAAEIGGPGLAGGLIQWITAPIAIFVDAISFFISAVVLGWIKKQEPIPTYSQNSSNVFEEIRDGLRVLYSNLILRAFALVSLTSNFFADINTAVLILYITRTLKIEPVFIGTIFAIGSLGGLLGSLIAVRLAKLMGLGRVIVGTQFAVAFAMLMIPLAVAQFWIALPMLAFAQALWSLSAVIYVINTVSLRQSITPNQYQGRVTASLRFVTWGISPLGFLLGGFLGETVGIRATLFIAAIGPVFSILWLVLSPMPGFREMPSTEVQAEAETVAPNL